MHLLPTTLRALLFLVGFALSALANPEPDIPVHCHFDKDGSITLRVEVDPRCFTQDPMSERFLTNVDLTHSSPEFLNGVKKQVADALPRWLQFKFEPEAKLSPHFTLGFTGQNQAALVKADDPIVVTATWKFTPPADTKSVQVIATRDSPFAVVVRYDVEGVEQEKFATLFPGESSFKMTPAKQQGR